VVEVATRGDFHDFEARLRQRRFAEDQEDGVICRRRRLNGLILDAMPSQPGILGFDNRWQGAAIPHAVVRELPSGATIRTVSPPYLVATKLEAFKGRGNRDFLGSRDFGDYIARELRDLLEDPRFADGVFGALRPDAASLARADAIVMPRLPALIS
jgi:hypothetical protein